MMFGLAVEGGPAMALVRGGADAALLCAFGSLLSIGWLAGPVLARVPDRAAVARRLRRLGWLALAAAGLLTLAWLLLESADLAGSPAGVGVVLQSTLFGHLVLARLLLLSAAALLLAWRRPQAAMTAAALAVLTQAGHGHGFAMTEGPSWLLVSDALHVLAASAWLGGLVPLAVLIASSPPDAARLASQRFSRLALGAVVILVATAIYQGSILIGGLPGWVGTGYGTVALFKLGLLLVLLGFAAVNRWRLTPALAGARPIQARSRLAGSIAFETVVGLGVVLAAGLLTSLPPAMHEQPNWPFPWRLSFDAINEDESFRQEVVLAGASIAAAVLAAAGALLFRRRVGLVVLALAGLVVFRAAPHLDLLLAEAYPTYYWRSPTGFATASIAQGAALFGPNCASCHGASGHGDGPAAAALSIPPADLTAEHLWAHADGELFWWVSHGIDAPEGGLAMPGFAGALTVPQRWAVIDWVRANNAGQAWLRTGSWPRPVQAPTFEAECGDAGEVSLAALRGEVVRIVFGDAAPQPGVRTLLVAPAKSADPRACVGRDASILPAYAAVTGLAEAKLAGAELLVDRDGWLRALQLPADQPGWNDPNALSAAVKDIDAHKLKAAPVSHAGMNM